MQCSGVPNQTRLKTFKCLARAMGKGIDSTKTFSWRFLVDPWLCILFPNSAKAQICTIYKITIFSGHDFQFARSRTIFRSRLRGMMYLSGRVKKQDLRSTHFHKTHQTNQGKLFKELETSENIFKIFIKWRDKERF